MCRTKKKFRTKKVCKAKKMPIVRGRNNSIKKIRNAIVVP